MDERQDTETLKRWAEDEWRYSPYQYSEELLVWKGNAWRCLNSNEHIRTLGFQDKHLAVTDASPKDARCELAGDAMPVQVLVRLFATLPGAWPPLEQSCAEGGLVVHSAEAAEPWGAKGEVQREPMVDYLHRTNKEQTHGTDADKAKQSN